MFGFEMLEKGTKHPSRFFLSLGSHASRSSWSQWCHYQCVVVGLWCRLSWSSSEYRAICPSVLVRRSSRSDGDEMDEMAHAMSQ